MGMTSKQLAVAAAAVLVILASGAVFLGWSRAERAYLHRRPVTERYMVCSACKAKYRVTQADLMKMDLRGATRDKEGVYVVPCAQCGKVAAKLIIEVPDEKVH